jgi:hypothetical protein
MMRPLVLTWIVLAGGVGSAGAALTLDATRLNQIIAGDACTNAPPAQLQAIPRFPKSVQKVTFIFASGQTNSVEQKGTEKYVETRNDEKTVDGRYIVRTLDLGTEGRLYAVITYDPDLVAFRRWMVFPDGAITVSTGLMDPTRRAIAWRARSEDGHADYLAIEMYEAKKVRWEARTFRDGRLFMREEGTAVAAE